MEISMEKNIEEILKTEYSTRFDEIRKNMMIVSYFKYGSMKENYEKFKCMDALGNIEKRIQKYKETMGYYAIVTSEIEDDDKEIINK